MQPGVFFALEKPLELRSLRFEPGHLLARFFRAGAEFRVDLAHGIDMPAKPEKNEARHGGGETRTGQEPSVGFQRLGR